MIRVQGGEKEKTLSAQNANALFLQRKKNSDSGLSRIFQQIFFFLKQRRHQIPWGFLRGWRRGICDAEQTESAGVWGLGGVLPE